MDLYSYKVVLNSEVKTPFFRWHVGQGDVVQLVNEKYRDWSNSQDNVLKPYGEEQDKEPCDKEKIAAIFEKLVQCCEPVISDGEGKLESDLIIGH